MACHMEAETVKMAGKSCDKASPQMVSCGVEVVARARRLIVPRCELFVLSRRDPPSSTLFPTTPLFPSLCLAPTFGVTVLGLALGLVVRPSRPLPGPSIIRRIALQRKCGQDLEPPPPNVLAQSSHPPTRTSERHTAPPHHNQLTTAVLC